MKQEGFLRRVFTTSAAVAVYAALFLLALGWVREAVSWTLGAALGIGVFAGTVLVVTRAMTPEEPRTAETAEADTAVEDPSPTRRRWFRGRGWVLAVAFCKWLVAGWLIWFVVRWPYAHIWAFLAGAGVVQAVLFLKALGQMLADSVSDPRDRKAGPGADRRGANRPPA